MATWFGKLLQHEKTKGTRERKRDTWAETGEWWIKLSVACGGVEAAQPASQSFSQAWFNISECFPVKNKIKIELSSLPSVQKQTQKNAILLFLQITEWKRKECKTRNDWRTLTISHLSIWKITFVTKSITECQMKTILKIIFLKALLV